MDPYIESDRENITGAKWLKHYNSCRGKESVDLSRLDVGYSEIELLILQFATNTVVKTLALRENRLGNDIHLFIDALALHNTTLQSLDLEGNLFNSDQVINSICNYISTSKCLTHFVINGTTRDYLIPIVQTLLTNTVMKSIELCTCSDPNPPTNTEDEYFRPISRLIDHNTTLHSINFSYNCFAPRQMIMLSAALFGNTTLTKVHCMNLCESWDQDSLYHERCFEAGGKILENLRSNITIRDLKIYYSLEDQKCEDARAGGVHHEKVENYNKRNISLLWKNVRCKVLDFVLIFYFLPAYVQLEIFDWLPLMHLVNHVKKIHLIIAVKKSINKLRN